MVTFHVNFLFSPELLVNLPAVMGMSYINQKQYIGIKGAGRVEQRPVQRHGSWPCSREMLPVGLFCKQTASFLPVVPHESSIQKQLKPTDSGHSLAGV